MTGRQKSSLRSAASVSSLFSRWTVMYNLSLRRSGSIPVMSNRCTSTAPNPMYL